ncbi:MAG TPA: tRNA pseudouridine(55) synthase TruB [Vicinamibacterales bacterium]|nr:tRNA pseudouridine(55) synthase TruB [Vicinamibacterales bacterium]
MDGVLVVDKPQAVTSHDVVAEARRRLGQPRIGHTGTLDPLATGVLPLACGRATRLVRFLTAADKEYEAGLRFGVSTDSYDIMGRELMRSGLTPSKEAVERALASLRGEYLQVPPAHSAKRVGGRRAYELARRDEEVTLAPVRVRVTRADLVTLDGASAIVAITCSSGFYVRSFAHALGELTGTGACVESLRRTRHGEFSLSQAVTVEQLRQGAAAVGDRWIPLDRLLPGLPSVRVSAEGRTRVSHGQELQGSHLLDEAVEGSDSWIRLLDEDNHLLAVATASSARALHPAVVLI